MYTLKLKRSGKLAEIALGDRGRIVRRQDGDRCVTPSLAVAQELAKLFSEIGLLA